MQPPVSKIRVFSKMSCERKIWNENVNYTVDYDQANT